MSRCFYFVFLGQNNRRPSCRYAKSVLASFGLVNFVLEGGRVAWKNGNPMGSELPWAVPSLSGTELELERFWFCSIWEWETDFWLWSLQVKCFCGYEACEMKCFHPHISSMVEREWCHLPTSTHSHFIHGCDVISSIVNAYNWIEDLWYQGLTDMMNSECQSCFPCYHTIKITKDIGVEATVYHYMTNHVHIHIPVSNLPWNRLLTTFSHGNIHSISCSFS